MGTIKYLYAKRKGTLIPYYASYTKIHSAWIIDSNVRAKTMKLVEENKGENPCDLGLVNIS